MRRLLYYFFTALVSYIFLLLIFFIFFIFLDYLPINIAYPIIDILNQYFEWGHSNSFAVSLIFLTFCIMWTLLFLKILKVFKFNS